MRSQFSSCLRHRSPLFNNKPFQQNRASRVIRAKMKGNYWPVKWISKESLFTGQVFLFNFALIIQDALFCRKGLFVVDIFLSCILRSTIIYHNYTISAIKLLIFFSYYMAVIVRALRLVDIRSTIFPSQTVTLLRPRSDSDIFPYRPRARLMTFNIAFSCFQDVSAVEKSVCQKDNGWDKC